MKQSVSALAVVMSLSAGAAFAETAPGDVVITDDMTVPASLTGQPGDAAAGRKAFVERKLGNCLACHQNADLASEPFHGDVGPALDGVAERWSVEELRAIIVNSKAVFGENTIMPGFYVTDPNARVREPFRGKTVLSAQEVEDVVAYLATLKE